MAIGTFKQLFDAGLVKEGDKLLLVHNAIRQRDWVSHQEIRKVVRDWGGLSPESRGDPRHIWSTKLNLGPISDHL